MRAWSRFSKDDAGASAVEFALVSLPFMMFVLGILQFVMLHYTQVSLSDALYTTASLPQTDATKTALINEDLTTYKTNICAKMAFKTDCMSKIVIEMMKLDDLPTGKTDISGASFDSGASGDLLVLRAKMPAPQIAPLIPVLTAKDSVLFRRS